MTALDHLRVWATDPDPGGDAAARVMGDLYRSDDDACSFTYAEDWRGHQHRFALSWSMPLSSVHHSGPIVRHFFQNLLPEGQARRAVTQSLGLSESNDWALLVAIGGDCAGALSVLPPTERPGAPEAWAYEPIAQTTLDELTDRRTVVPLLVGGTSTRLSLAGAQDKLPVTVIDDALHLPLNSAPSTHILKLTHPDYADLAANEAFVTALARRAGLDAVDSELFLATTPPSLLVKRFDRTTASRSRPALRLHQEDFCQALGLPAGRKYEQEGGPTLAVLAELIRRASVDPIGDVQSLLRWAVFNVCAGNADAHGKNLAFLHTHGGVRLAPAYDLVSTRLYPRIERRLAMSVGSVTDMDDLRAAHWERQARKLEMGRNVVLRFVRATAEAVLEALEPTREAFAAQFGESSIPPALPGDIERRTRSVLRGLSS